MDDEKRFGVLAGWRLIDDEGLEVVSHWLAPVEARETPELQLSPTDPACSKTKISAGDHYHRHLMPDDAGLIAAAANSAG
jgi:hypothetical protein